MQTQNNSLVERLICLIIGLGSLYLSSPAQAREIYTHRDKKPEVTMAPVIDIKEIPSPILAEHQTVTQATRFVLNQPTLEEFLRVNQEVEAVPAEAGRVWVMLPSGDYRTTTRGIIPLARRDLVTYIGIDNPLPDLTPGKIRDNWVNGKPPTGAVFWEQIELGGNSQQTIRLVHGFVNNPHASLVQHVDIKYNDFLTSGCVWIGNRGNPLYNEQRMIQETGTLGVQGTQIVNCYFYNSRYGVGIDTRPFIPLERRSKLRGNVFEACDIAAMLAASVDGGKDIAGQEGDNTFILDARTSAQPSGSMVKLQNYTTSEKIALIYDGSDYPLQWNRYLLLTDDGLTTITSLSDVQKLVIDSRTASQNMRLAEQMQKNGYLQMRIGNDILLEPFYGQIKEKTAVSPDLWLMYDQNKSSFIVIRKDSKTGLYLPDHLIKK